MQPNHLNFYRDDNNWSSCTKINWEMTKYKLATNQKATEDTGSTALLTPNPDSDQYSILTSST